MGSIMVGIRETGQIEETLLCEDLREIGINATVLDRRTSIYQQLLVNPLSHWAGPSWLGTLDGNVSYLTWGCIKIEEHNINLIQLELISKHRPDGVGNTRVSSWNYVVLVDIKNLERELKANFFLNQWQGGQLANMLNTDLDLKIKLSSLELDILEIRPHTKQKCVSITPVSREAYKGIKGYGDNPAVWAIKQEFPTLEAFESYDKIARHIRGYLGFKFCMRCGENIPKDAQFCPKCGEKQS